jgi:dienelactone hydrolase
MNNNAMQMLVFLAALCCPSFAQAQNQFDVLDWKTEYSVNTFLIQKIHRQSELRHHALDTALRSQDRIRAYQETCRKSYLQILGSLPQRSALHAMVTGTVRRDGYSIEKIIYESFEHHHVTANLYLPDGKGPFPAALLFCGHEDAGKATESYQKTAILFARNGIIVFVIDPLSQSERRQMTDTSGVPTVRGGTTEHTLLNASSNLLGTSVAAYELWDNIRGLDYLETRPEVDTTRIGCLGNSGGGMQTVYFMGFDVRVKVGAVCSFLTSRERTFELSQAFDGCSQIPGEGKMQLEMSDFLIAAAPKPILVLAGRYDFIDYDGTLAAFKELKQVYEWLHQSDRVSLFTYDDGHGMSKPKREAAVTWFRRWLYDDSTHVTESGIAGLPEKELCCTSTGQVNSFFKNEATVVKRNLSFFDILKKNRVTFLQASRETVISRIMNVLAIQSIEHEVDIETMGEVNAGACSWQKMIVRKRGEIPLPLLLAFPPIKPVKVVVWLTSQGKNTLADSADFVQKYLQTGAAVILCDLRGLGETADKSELNDPKYFNREYRNAMLALHAGESLVGERTKDVLTVLDYIASNEHLKCLPIKLDASGCATLPALHALLFNQTVAQLNLHGSIRSFKTILLNPTKKDWYSFVIPDVLRNYDIPDIVRLVGSQNVNFIE